MERAAKVSGSRFAYIKGDLVLLEFALVQYALGVIAGRGFRPVIPPVLVREEAMYGTGFFPTDRAQVYETVDGDCLVGTSEVPLAAMHMEEFLEAEKLPLRYAGFSTCFRREAGAAGRDTRGILRVHQFDKVEMFSFCLPEQSAAEHELILAAEEEILQGLGIPYRVVNIAAGDLGAPAAQKFDCEAWLPGQEQYREVTSCSNCTDYQARRLNCRFRTEKGPRFVHTLNGTGVAVGRTLIAIMENYQQADGSIVIPERAAALDGQGRDRRLSAADVPRGRRRCAPPALSRSATSPTRPAGPARSTAGRRRTPTSGTTSDRNDAGAISSMLAPNWRSCVKIATVIGCVLRAKVSATSRSFQVHRNWKMASEAIAGRLSGSTRRKKMPISEAPSMRAASSSSAGNPTKKLRSRKMANGRPKAVWNRMRPAIVSNSPRWLYSEKMGISAIWMGTTSSPMTTMNSQSRPGKSSQAKA